MKKLKLSQFVFMALCCDLGIITKKLVSPAANLITDSLHIPGGIGTSFSLMFLVIGAALAGQFGCGALMGLIQCGIALSLGMTGSMGILSFVGYIIPGLIVDIVLWSLRNRSKHAALMTACITAPLAASLTADLIVFRLHGIVLLLYLCVSCTTGAICGTVAIPMFDRLSPLIRSVDIQSRYEGYHKKEESI